jgi:hypothetical protein
MTQVLVDAVALNALCEEAAKDMRFRHLVSAVRGSVKAPPRVTPRRPKAPTPAEITETSTQVESL